MDAKLKRKWVAALRSGKYKQGTNALHEDRAYCCLGVLATVSGCRWRNGYPLISGHHVDDGGELLSPTIFGLPAPIQKKLARKNDKGEPFDRIADYIEEHL